MSDLVSHRKGRKREMMLERKNVVYLESASHDRFLAAFVYDLGGRVAAAAFGRQTSFMMLCYVKTMQGRLVSGLFLSSVYDESV